MSVPRRQPRQLPPISNLPPLPAPFVGRDEEIADTHQRLTDHVTVLVHDPEGRPHGYGTSQLAISYGHLYTLHYQLIWLFDCGQETDPARLADRVEKETERLSEALEKSLGEPLDGPTAADWLFIYDNVAEPDGIRRHFPEGNARILVTSRFTGTWDERERVCVGPLGHAESVRLLKENMSLDQLQAARLADTFGGHPKQIVRAGEAVLAGRVTAEEIATVVEIAWLAPPQRRAGVPDGVRTSLRSCLLRSAVCRDSGSYGRFTEALRRRTTGIVPRDVLTSDMTMAERVDVLLDAVFEQDDPAALRVLADAVEEETESSGSGRQMAATVRRIVDELLEDQRGTPAPPTPLAHHPARVRSLPPPRSVPEPTAEKEYPFFFTSWHNRDADGDEVQYFHQLLEKEVAVKLPARLGKTGFLDWNMEPGTKWESLLVEAIRTTRILVPLITEDYFTREWCRREWAVMVQRMANVDAAQPQEPIAILPVFWVRPMEGWRMPEDFGLYQHRVRWDGEKAYDGHVYDLVRDKGQPLTEYVRSLVRAMVKAAATPLPQLDRHKVMRVPLAFRDVNESSR
ncbi:TIR domain-containing protein [Streptomyces resistomycificus]|uniref:TIR domain-containing protein n=1 Tax=Streptomyces resistomycificus TaxID=67356 RepID=A0A0L8L8G1_9ACTN|nr:TIR domain-containing protein [Streptomyces resistomycificus]KOG34488.1 hypothetical protein ADK37_18315 [Streptomyces resistomycificus]